MRQPGQTSAAATRQRGRHQGVDYEPLFDEDTYNSLIALYASRKRGRPNDVKYLLSGIARCGRCGTVVYGRPRANMKPYGDGEMKRQYFCHVSANTHATACGRICVDQRDADRCAQALVVAILSDRRHAASIEAAARNRDDLRAHIETEIAECEDLADQLAERLGRREIDLRRYDIASGPNGKRLIDLKAQLDQLGDVPGIVSTEEVVARSRSEWERRWAGADVPERRRLILLALQGKRLVINPVDIHAPRVFDPRRIVVE